MIETPEAAAAVSYSARLGLSSPPPRQPKSIDLELISVLGAGGYGKVSLVCHKKDRRRYALKRVAKAHLLHKNGLKRCEWLRRERDILGSIGHPFVIDLHGTYADERSIYLLLAVAIGGDLFRLMEKLGRVPERVARFYVASLVMVLAHIHSRDIVYRDLKPENVLLDSQGYIKLCDFGFAKRITTDRTYTPCGTPDYTAPEMLLSQGVNQACDWWALGVLLFEMLIGTTPFTDPGGDDMKTFRNITHGSLSTHWPRDQLVSPEARALAEGLCQVKLPLRLGYLTGGVEDVMGHAWFGEAYDWDGLVNLTKEPPWRPRLEACDDRRCFDSVDEDDALDGPKPGRERRSTADPELLEQTWLELQGAYKSRGEALLDEMSHLTAPPSVLERANGRAPV